VLFCCSDLVLVIDTALYIFNDFDDDDDDDDGDNNDDDDKTHK